VREERKKRSLPGFKPVTPYVFAGVYPIDTDDYEKLKVAFEKLSLNDSALAWEYEQSVAMGHGFRCGFLGTLHMDIIKERLSREYGMETLFTIPTVLYMTKLKYLKHPAIVAETNIKDLVQT
jgi:GTP-binding protein LepA